MNSRLEAWAERLAVSPLPLLKATADELRAYLAQKGMRFEEVASIIHRDPCLAAHMLRVVNGRRGAHLSGEVGTVMRAAMLLGLDHLRELPNGLPTVEKLVTDERHRRHLLRVMTRAHHVAWQADDWARINRDITPDEVYVAALLHAIGEIMMWVHAPKEALEIETMIREEHAPPEEAQYVVLGFTYEELSLALAQRWHYPHLVCQALEPQQALNRRAHGIMLADKLGRMAEAGWYHDGIYHCQEEVALYLEAELDETVARIHETALDCARSSPPFGVALPAARLVQLPDTLQTISEAFKAHRGLTDDGEPLPFCLIPQRARLEEVLEGLNAQRHDSTLDRIIELALDGLHDGLALNRVLFAVLTPDHSELRAHAVKGADTDLAFDRFEVVLSGSDHLFSRLMHKPMAVWFREDNRARIEPLLPIELKARSSEDFFAMSIFAMKRPVGLLYGDRHGHTAPLTEEVYAHFKKVCIHTSKALERLPTYRYG